MDLRRRAMGDARSTAGEMERKGLETTLLLPAALF
jgi:hypothetical protein